MQFFVWQDVPAIKTDDVNANSASSASAAPAISDEERAKQEEQYRTDLARVSVRGL